MKEKAETYWQLKMPDGKLSHIGLPRTKEEFEKRYSKELWKHYLKEGYSVTEVELNEVGKHPDSLRLNKYNDIIKKNKKVAKRVLKDYMLRGFHLRDSLDRTTGRK